MTIRYYTVLILLLLASCSKKEQDVKDAPSGSYFSIVQYAQDQWEVYHGNAFGMYKKVSLNGEVDSTVTNALDADWGSILKVFFETDISDKKYIGKYDFSMFDDETTMTRSYYYEAKDKKLYTKKLQIMADYYTNKIKSIYIEAEKVTRMGTRSVKLLYVPLDVISIQELETTKTGQKKDLRIEYKFM